MKRLVLAAALAAISVPAFAADLQLKAQPYVLPAATCTATDCSGFYLGAGMVGLGQAVTAAVPASPFPIDFTAAGSMAEIHAGYITLTPTYLLGIEAGVGGQMSAGIDQALPKGSKRFVGMVDVKAGRSLSGLIGVTPLTDPNAPFNMNTVVANSIAYMHGGTWLRGDIGQGEMGVGAMLPLTKGWFAEMEYTYGPPSNGMEQFHAVQIKINRLFSGI